MRSIFYLYKLSSKNHSEKTFTSPLISTRSMQISQNSETNAEIATPFFFNTLYKLG